MVTGNGGFKCVKGQAGTDEVDQGKLASEAETSKPQSSGSMDVWLVANQEASQVAEFG